MASAQAVTIDVKEPRFDLEEFDYYIDNPSAWSEGFDQRISDQMKAAAAEICRRRSPGVNARLLAAVKAMEADYQTSETHHPQHVLVPLAAFNAMRETIATADSASAHPFDGLEEGPYGHGFIEAEAVDDLREIEAGNTNGR